MPLEDCLNGQREKNFIYRLKTGFTIKTLSHLLSCPDKTIKETSIRTIFTTYIQLMFKIIREMNHVIFPGKEQLCRFLAKIFKTINAVLTALNFALKHLATLHNKEIPTALTSILLPTSA